MAEWQIRCAGCAAPVMVPAGRMADGLKAAGWSFVTAVARCPSCGPHQTAAPSGALPGAGASAATAGAPTGVAASIAAAPSSFDAAARPYGRDAIARAERAGLEPDSVLRARINAGVLDNIVVNLCWVLLRLIAGVSIASVDALVLFLGCQFLYFFMFESRDGSTPGKRRYGLKVVTLDGERPGTGALAVRNALRLVDSLPIFYASGLLSLMRTGRRRRQRIGDVAAGTTVVSADPTVQRLRTPRWLLPAACSFALLLGVATTIGVVRSQSPNRHVTSADEVNFIAGCSRTSTQPGECRCLFETMRDSYGLDTPARMRGYFQRVQIALTRRDTSLLPAGFVAMARTCHAQAAQPSTTG